MRDQAARDQQTITIATALGIIVVILVVGGLLLAFANIVGDMPDRLNSGLAFATATLAVVAGLVYLVRNRRV
ncbi:hypothetical protein [Nocardioides jejuensis]|uniref:Uncharacterized protein n=1 Tax=Nocardioides jejuensis TaxID=2502782 RepID=A0A4R1BWE1_9ACTN|nr:hypothetical protein [Nocardioides jejuensis]TCJ21585.1 hypothetical protein EPD65_14710 [Nocardioides jejuensis]